MELRWYQTEAVLSVWNYIRQETGNPCVVLPTGAGKTPVIAELCRNAVLAWDGRVLILAHVKELLEQTADKLRILCPTVQFGVYSAGLKKRETTQQVIVAGIQSVHKKANELGRFDLVIVDEAHLIPASGDGMYRSLISDLIELNPDMRVIGLTATPYRMGQGMICGKDNLLTEICFEAGVKPLIAQGYLCSLISKAARQEIDTSTLKIERGEYVEEQAETLFTDGNVVELACRELVQMTDLRRSVLVFCQTVAHAQQVASQIRCQLVQEQQAALNCLQHAEEAFGQITTLGDHRLPIVRDWLEERYGPELVRPIVRYLEAGNEIVGEIYGETPDEERADIFRRFRAGSLKYLVNVNVATTGFDAPNVDAVCLLRATASPGLYYQMVGRGFRLHPDKQNCLILDFGTNVRRHGPVDQVQKQVEKKAKGIQQGDGGKTCPECQTVVATNFSVCLDCGHVFSANPVTANHSGTADTEDVVSGKPKRETCEVLAVTYSVHTKKDASDDHPKTLRVAYKLNLTRWVSEWVCVEHQGFAFGKAQKWWSKRCNWPIVTKAIEAVQYGQQGLLAQPISITLETKPGSQFPEIVSVELGDIPEHCEPCVNCETVRPRVIDDRYRIVCTMCGHDYRGASIDEVVYFGIYDGNCEGRGGVLIDLKFTLNKPSLFQQIEQPEPDLDIPF